MFSDQDIFVSISPQDTLLFSEMNDPILQNTFILNQTPVNLVLTRSYIALTTSSQLGYHCLLTFSVKFEVIRAQWENQRTPGKPLGLWLQKQNSQTKVEFLCDSPEIVNLWARQLQKKINQRNFHKLFKAKRKIGKGAFATVYLAQRLIDQKMVAVKAFSKQKQYSGDKGRQSLQNEIKIMRLLSHENIMKLEGIYETQNSIYVILEYLQGVQLNEEIKNHRIFKIEEVRIILKGILEGINHLSSKRIIHRDLKPENIMFRRKNSLEVAICDFGLATYADEEKYLFVRCGTPGFVAPEIINIKDMNIKSEPISDVFSAGIIFHYLLLNKSVFPGTRYSDILTQNRACDFDFSKEEYQNLESHTLDLLKRMLAKKPQYRISAEDAMNHSFFNDQIDSQMQIEENKPSYPVGLFKQRDISMVQTPSTLKTTTIHPNLKKKNSNPPLNRYESFEVKKDNKQNMGIVPFKKTLSTVSRNTRSKSKNGYRNRMIDQNDENQ